MQRASAASRCFSKSDANRDLNLRLLFSAIRLAFVASRVLILASRRLILLSGFGGSGCRGGRWVLAFGVWRALARRLRCQAIVGMSADCRPIHASIGLRLLRSSSRSAFTIISLALDGVTPRNSPICL